MEKEFDEKLKTNNIWYINHSPWTAKTVFDYEKLHLNCIFTLCVNTCMRRFEIRESIQSLLLAALKTGHEACQLPAKRLWKRYFKIAFQEAWFSKFWRKTTISIKERGFKTTSWLSPRDQTMHVLMRGLTGQCESAGSWQI